MSSYYKYSDGKYYGLPHYESFFGIIYDVDMFEEELLYFADEVDKIPSTEHCDYYCFLFFAYNDKTNTVRYVFAEGEEEYVYTPYFTDVEW